MFGWINKKSGLCFSDITHKLFGSDGDLVTERYHDYTPLSFYTQVPPLKHAVDIIVSYTANVDLVFADGSRGNQDYLDKFNSLKQAVIKNILLYGNAFIFIGTKNVKISGHVEMLDNRDVTFLNNKLRYGMKNFNRCITKLSGLDEMYFTVKNSRVFQQAWTIETDFNRDKFVFDHDLGVYHYHSPEHDGYIMCISHESEHENPAPNWFTTRTGCMQIINAIHYNNTQLVKGFKSKTVITTEQALGPQQADKMKKQYQKDDPILFIEGTGKVNLVDNSFRPKDMDYGLLIDKSAHFIYAVYEIPPSFYSKEAMTYSNHDTSRYILYDNVVKPYLQTVAQKVQSFFQLVLGEKVEIDLDNSDNDAIFAKKVEMAKTLQQTASVTTNEVRKKLDMEPLKGGDEPLVPLNHTLLSNLSDMDGDPDED